jgi:GST-like protein
VPYGIDRYTNEVNRLYGVMNKRLAGRDFLAGEYSIADMACVSWTRNWERQGQDPSQFPNVQRWLDRLMERPAVVRGLEVKTDHPPLDLSQDKEAQRVMFGQKAT